MVTSFEYDVTYIPAMPVAEIEIAGIKSAAGIRLTAVVDSGADATIFPIRYLRDARAHRSEKAWLRGIMHQRVRVQLYWVWMRIGSLAPIYIQTVADMRGEEAILGRDVLNQLVVTLNGLASTVEMSD